MAGKSRGWTKALSLMGTTIVAAALMAGPASASKRASDPNATKLRVDVTAQRFKVEGDRVVARGPVTATAVEPDGTTKTVTQPVDLTLKTTQSCRIIDLHLAKLYVNLLGLEVRTSTINAKVTGDPKRALGKIFCQLSRGINLSRHQLAVHSARSLNHRLGDRGLHLLSFSAPVHPQQQTSAASNSNAPAGKDVPPPSPDSCQVLDLLLGPLHLDVLGLVVDLYGATSDDEIEVLVTADPNGGELGASLCQPAPPPSG